jgi:hypothetical protein
MKKKELRRQVKQLRSQLRAVQLDNLKLHQQVACRDWHIMDLQRNLSLTEVERDVLKVGGGRPN